MVKGMRTRRSVLGPLILSVMIVSPHLGWAGVPVVRESDILITDVTDRSFSVVWNSSEPSTGSLNVFDGSACTVPTLGASIISHPVLDPDPTVQSAVKTAAEENGILKVQVTGLAPSTEYCVQTVTTSTSTSDETIAPTPALTLTTETQVTRTYTADSNPDLLPFANDIVSFPVYRPALGITGELVPLPGAIVAVDLINPGSSPVTGFVGDGVAAPFSLTDMNNLFDEVSRENINLLGGERMRILEYRGYVGCKLERFRKVPADLDLAEVKPPGACFDRADLDCNDTVDVRDIVRDINGFGTALGGFCFNTDLDQNDDNTVDVRDIILVIGKFGSSP